MPPCLHGATAESDARAIAAYLGSLKSGQPVKPVPVDADAISAGQALYKQLNCAACHTLEKEPAAPGKLALGQAQRLAKRVRCRRSCKIRRHTTNGFACQTSRWLKKGQRARGVFVFGSRTGQDGFAGLRCLEDCRRKKNGQFTGLLELPFDEVGKLVFGGGDL